MTDYTKTRGLVIRTSEYAETSQIVTVWTETHGKLRCIVKGARRGKAGGGVGLDILELCEIVLIRRASGLSIVSEWQVLEDFATLRTNLEKLYASLYSVELVNTATDEGDADPHIFELLLRFLTAMAGGTPPYPALLRLELLFLRRIGLAPAVDSCIACKGELGYNAAFVPSEGGCVCGPCKAGVGNTIALSRRAISAITALAAERPPVGFNITPATIRVVRKLLDEHLAYHLERRLKMRMYVEPPVDIRNRVQTRPESQ